MATRVPAAMLGWDGAIGLADGSWPTSSSSPGQAATRTTTCWRLNGDIALVVVDGVARFDMRN
jgi:hypothetical protein